MSYIDKTYVQTLLSETVLDRLLSYGNVTSGSLKDDRLQHMIDAAESTVNSYLIPAGYSVPLSSVPANVKMATYYLTISFLYNASHQPFPEQLKVELDQNYSFLNAVKSQVILLENNPQSTTTGTGGSYFNYNLSYSSQNPRILDIKNLRGTYI